MFQGSFNRTLKRVVGCFKGVKEFSRKSLFHESLESVTTKIEECFQGV